MPERRRERAHDVVIVGGGVMGCACAWELSRHGARVTVLEKSVPGAEASSAAAGILGAQVEAHGPGPMLTLSLASRARYPRFAADLAKATGIDVGFRASGVLRVAFDQRTARRIISDTSWQRAAELPFTKVDRDAARKLEPALSRAIAGGVLFADDARIEPRVLLRALHVAAQRAGVNFRTGAYVKSVAVREGRARGVTLEDGSEIAASHVVVAAGSWTTLIGGLGLPSGAVRPARGQIVELESPSPLLTRVVFGPRCYLVPRDDGRTLVGSTLEFVGYRREVTAQAVRDLLDAAIELVPGLGDAVVTDSWSNFRPYTDDELPLVGPTPIEGLVLATGHYRNGILLAPITADIVAAVIGGRRLPVPLSAFDARRLI